MPASVFAEWLAFYEIDPFGDQRGDLQAAVVASALSNRWRGKGEKPNEPVDFMPFVERRQQTPEEMRSVLAAALGGISGTRRRN